LAVPLCVNQLSEDVIHQLQPAAMILVSVFLELGSSLTTAFEDLAEGLQTLGGLVIIACGWRQGKGGLLMSWLRKVGR
jgi:hypothetical protein